MQVRVKEMVDYCILIVDLTGFHAPLNCHAERSIEQSAANLNAKSKHPY